ncbi:hypothetical protein HNO86_29200 [Pseudomonas sp. C1C7]|uniref:hypothetical protein n=1 Tax=Pseudomonas sp. C1C7 TaxID=2735272 RepID=UPI0015865BD9|nr:hypothetical protein [Pseudomonas sp. C1C7]NUT79127.1 hypothetical protein [Pseudomonas sp. C1C7]
MFNFDKTLELPLQLHWKHAEEQESMAWSIRARNYNTFVANCMLAFMLFFLLALSVFLYTAYHDISQPWRTLWCLLFYALMSLVILSMTHQRINFAYRITQFGVEYCKWKHFPRWMLPFLKWFTGITAVIFICMASIDPAFLIGALIGPGGMGLMYLSMANSKSYQEMQTEYHNNFYHWTQLTKSTVATNRDMVELEFIAPSKDGSYMASGSLYVFFNKHKKEQVVDVIKTHLPPGVPCVIGKVDVWQ